ncbi:MAG: cellulase family glycosylhydrolase [Devosia sp.]
MSDLASADARLSTTVREAWDGGAVVDLTLGASAGLDGWQVEVDAGGTIVNIWNAQVLEQNGTVYTLGAVDYNQTVAAGTSLTFGFEMEGNGVVSALGFQVTRASDAGIETAAQDTGDSVGPIPSPSPAPVAPDSPATPPSVSPTVLGSSGTQLRETSDTQGVAAGGLLTVEGSRVAEPIGTGDGLPEDSFAPGPFSTRGASIIDSAGNPVSIHGVNWFGFETDIFVAHGLWARNWRAMMDEVKSLGFNAMRIPFSGEFVDTGGANPSGIDYALNPDLVDLTGLEILDAIVDYAETIGLRILLDYHRGPPGGGPNDNGLWFGDGRTEADVIDEWRVMAERYHDKPAVIGADLVNEPHAGTWGDGSATDWAAAAERIGNAVLAVAPDWLIIVEGIGTYDGDTYWWGGNLQGVRDRPVVLSEPNKLVYSPHDYPNSVHSQPWFIDGSNLEDVFRKNWGFIAEEGIAPVLMGEWGSRLETQLDLTWANAISNYMEKLDIPWMWWSWNPNSGDTGGVLADDWQTPRQSVLSLLDRFLPETQPDVPLTATDAIDAKAIFRIGLDGPSDDDVVLKYATANGTAKAGEDYVATAGQLIFSPGETEKTVAVPVLPDTQIEGDEFFYLVLGGAGGMRASGTAIITDEDHASRRGALPRLDVASTVVTEATGVANFRLILSDPATQDVTVSFKTVVDSAGDQDFASTTSSVVIPQGARGAVLEVSLDDDTTPETAERFTLELMAAEGAVIRNGKAIGMIAAEPPGAAEINVAASPTAQTQLTIDLILENDWGSGALFNVIIKNVSDQPVSGWSMAFDLPFDLTEIWSAVLVADQGERVTVGNADWNGTIAPGQTVDFGFISDMGGIDMRGLLAGADLELAVQ